MMRIGGSTRLALWVLLPALLGGCGSAVNIPAPVNVGAPSATLTTLRVGRGEQVSRQVSFCAKRFPRKEDMRDALVAAGYQVQLGTINVAGCGFIVRFRRGQFYGDVEAWPTGGDCSKCGSYTIRLQESRFGGRPEPWRSTCPWTDIENMLEVDGERPAYFSTDLSQPSCPPR